MTFMVDSCTEKSSIIELPASMEIGKGRINISGIGAKTMVAPVSEQVLIQYEERRAQEELIYLPQVG